MLCVHVPSINQPPLAPWTPLFSQVPHPTLPRGRYTQRLRPYTTDVQGAEKCLKIFLLIKGALQTCYIHIYFPLFFNLLLHQLLKKKAERRK